MTAEKKQPRPFDFRAQLLRVREMIKNIAVVNNPSAPTYNAPMASELYNLLMSLEAVLNIKNPLQLRRPDSCVCLRTNLRNGTTSNHCAPCLDQGYVVESDPKQHKIMTIIDSYRNLPLNWDNIGGVPPDVNTRTVAHSIADVLGIETQLVPCPDGSIEFYKDQFGIIYQINVLTYKP